ncbi:hypothetical protein Q3G72_031593 [Acer saccharum]|nr:hypothetical protein Q3G72_010850 [Acer saccharum]KAK1555815.1 hypothetical protein Q3G72_031593 [Acer saccharum]
MCSTKRKGKVRKKAQKRREERLEFEEWALGEVSSSGPSLTLVYPFIPAWPYLKAMAIILLVLPFHGASFFYHHVIRAYFVDKLQMGNISFVPKKQGFEACIPDAAKMTADTNNVENEPKELEKRFICQETLETTRSNYSGRDRTWSTSVKKAREWSCALCQINTSSNRCLEDHLQGKKHKIREQELKAFSLETRTRQKYSSMPNKNNNGMILPGRLNQIAKVNLAKWHGFVRSIMWCRWKKPEFGWTKLNTNGSVDRHNAGFGGLLRDHKGEPICAFVSKAHCDDIFFVSKAHNAGLLFGIGFAIALRVVDAVVGPRNNKVCGDQSRRLKECLNDHGNNISQCQSYMDRLQECRRRS